MPSSRVSKSSSVSLDATPSRKRMPMRQRNIFAGGGTDSPSTFGSPCNTESLPLRASRSPSSTTSPALAHVRLATRTVAPFWRLVFFALLAIQLGGAVCLIVLAQHREVDDTDAQNAERFENTASTLFSDLTGLVSNVNELVQHWRYVIPFVPSMEQFDLIFNRDAFPFDIIWLPHVPHAQRAAFEAAAYDDLSSFFNTSAVPHNITALVFNGSIAVGQEISPDKESYYPVRFTAPPLPPSFYLRDSTSESVRSSIVDAIVDARGESVVGERLLSYSGGTVNAISSLSAAAMSPTNTSHVLGVFTAYIRWQLFVPAQITTPTAGSMHMRIFDLTPDTDGCATPLLFSGTHNNDGSWTLAPTPELQGCLSTDSRASYARVLDFGGRALRVELTKAPGFDESVDSTQIILGSAFLVVTIAMLLFIIATGWFIVQHMKRTATTTAKYVEELTVAEQEARESKEHRDQFLAFLSHELRNPLFGLRGTLDEVAEHSVSPSSEPLPVYAHAAVDTLRNCSKQIERTLNTVVNVQNMANGKISLRSIPFRTSSLVRRLQSDIAEFAASRQVGVQVGVEASVPDALQGDFERVIEAVGHLLRNAVQYSPQSTTVNLRVELRDIAATPADKRKRLRSVRIGPSPHKYQHEFVTSKPKATDDGRVALQFVIVDKGPGLVLRQIKRAFQPYTRERIARASQDSGSSLGLPIAKLLCEQMDGFVRARSGPGQGSEFTAAMKLGIAHNVPDGLEQLAPSASQPLHADPPDVDISVCTARFLAVDDQKINRRLVSRILSKLMPEATVDVAEDGLDAVAKVAAADAAGMSYSCIFMDIQMPRMSGTQATRQLRLSGFSKPIIAVTGGTLEEEVAKYFRAGMVGVIHKPCKKTDFEQHIRKHWAEIGGAEQ